MLPRGVEIVHCKCGIERYPMTGVIIRCKRFEPYGKKRSIKNWLLLLLRNERKRKKKGGTNK